MLESLRVGYIVVGLGSLLKRILITAFVWGKSPSSCLRRFGIILGLLSVVVLMIGEDIFPESASVGFLLCRSSAGVEFRFPRASRGGSAP